MPPGASILMRGLGMRGTSRYIKNKKRGTKDPGAYDRPTVFCHDGVNYPVPPEFRGDEQFEIPPYMTDEDTAMAYDKYLENPLRSSEGLSQDYAWRLFEHERSKWARQGFISPYKDYRSRVARDDLEFRLWRYWHPKREEIKERINEGYDDLYGYGDRGRDQDPYRRPRDAVNYKPPPLRRRGLVDHRDPKNCPPYPAYGINEGRRGTYRRPRERFEARRDRNPREYSTARTTQGRRGAGRPFYSAYVPTRGRERSRVHDGYGPRREEIPAFIPRDFHHHRHGLDFEADDDDEDEEDARSQQSHQSFIRHRPRRHRPLPPHIVYPRAPPYYGRPLGQGGRRHGRHEDDDDIDDVLADELFRGRGAHMGHRRHPFSMGREGGRFRMGRRGYEDEGLDYGFSGDEDDEFDF